MIKENRKKKLKAWSCRYHAVGTRLNDFILLHQPLCYDQYCSTLHTIIIWYVHSTSIAGNDDDEEEDDNKVIDKCEWGYWMTNFTNGLFINGYPVMVTEGET